jgi:hypothetical protein
VPHHLVHHGSHVDLVAAGQSLRRRAQQPVDQVVQPVPVRSHPLEHVPLTGGQRADSAAQQQLAVADDARQWGAQLVADARDEIGVLLVAVRRELLGLTSTPALVRGTSTGRKAWRQCVWIDVPGGATPLPTPPGGNQPQWQDPRRFLKRVRHHKIAVSAGRWVDSMAPASRRERSGVRYRWLV